MAGDPFRKGLSLKKHSVINTVKDFYSHRTVFCFRSPEKGVIAYTQHSGTTSIR